MMVITLHILNTLMDPVSLVLIFTILSPKHGLVEKLKLNKKLSKAHMNMEYINTGL